MRARTLLTLALLLALAAPASAVQKEVIVTDNAFVPDATGLRVGDALHWWATGGSIANSHNVHEDHRLFRSGSATSGNISLTSVFSAGAFHYYCEIHGSETGGMDGIVRVKPKTASGPTGRPFTVRWASTATNTGSAFDVQFKVGGGAWQDWKTNTTAFKGVFGKNGSPVMLMDDKRYSFRARSQRSAGANATASRWSPAASFTV